MKVSSEWRKLTVTQRRAWNAWAKSNRVLLDDGNVRRVSGRKAMTMVLRNRTIAGEALNPTVVPAGVTWLTNALSTRDAGPYTTPPGQMVLRTEQALAAGTKWFIWATPPVASTEVSPHAKLRFVKFMSLGALAVDVYVPRFETEYRAACGSFDGPGAAGFWPEPHSVWFRVHQYANGQLGPGTMMAGVIQVDA
jgi:hypothetical protein